MIRKALAVTALAAAALISIMSGSANAAVVDNGNGTFHVDKGDVQTAFKWNNHEFDDNVNGLKFSVGSAWSRTYHFKGVCNGETFAGDIVTTGATKVVKTLHSNNLKQVTGWDLTKSSTVNYGNYHSQMNAYTMCKTLGGNAEPTESSVTDTGDVNDATIRVIAPNGESRVLPLTPVA